MKEDVASMFAKDLSSSRTMQFQGAISVKENQELYY